MDPKEQKEYERLINLRNARRDYVDLQRASNGQTGSRWGDRAGRGKIHYRARSRDRQARRRMT